MIFIKRAVTFYATACLCKEILGKRTLQLIAFKGGNVYVLTAVNGVADAAAALEKARALTKRALDRL